MLEKIISTVRTQTPEEPIDLWLSNESCNQLFKEAKIIKVTEGGKFKLKFNSGDIVEISTEGYLVYGVKNKIAYVRIMSVNAEFEAGKASKVIIL